MVLSIIVPVYNAEEYLTRCVESLLNQNIEHYEIILVNDGSTDSSTQIIDKYVVQYPDKVRGIHKENQGVAITRNRGMLEARGEFITYVDSDDYVVGNCYEEICLVAQREQADIVIYDAYKDYGNYKEVFIALKPHQGGQITSQDYVMSLPAPWNKIMRRSILMEHNMRFPEGIWYEDYAMIPALGNYTEAIYYIKKPMVNYYQSDNSITRNEGFRAKSADMFEAVEILDQAIKDKFPEEAEYLYWYYLTLQTALYYYQYEKWEILEQIADKTKAHYPKWYKNRYIKEESIRNRILGFLFYHKKCKWIARGQQIKVKLKRG